MNNRESVGLKHCNDHKVLIECSNDIDDIFDNIDEYSSNKKRKILIAFDDMIADMLSNKKPQSIVTRLFVKHFSCFYHIVFIRCLEKH